MGNYSTVEYQNKQRDDKIFRIEMVGNRLAQTYSEKYLDPDFCNQVTMVNNDDLIRFHHQKVNGRSYSFGYIGDVPHIKETICEGIQEEYRLKKELVNEILGCFQECNARMDSITRGPICQGNPEVFNEAECRHPNRWVQNITIPTRNVRENERWFRTLAIIHKQFMKGLTTLENILIDLENHDDSFSIEKTKRMLRIVEQIKQLLRLECGRFQRQLLTIPTFTPAEVRQKGLTLQESEQANEAKAMSLLMGPTAQ
jgi:hypothetical protein